MSWQDYDLSKLVLLRLNIPYEVEKENVVKLRNEYMIDGWTRFTSFEALIKYLGNLL